MTLFNCPMIPLSEFPAHLSSLTLADWQPLIDLIPVVEQTDVFGKEGEIKVNEDGVFILPYWEPAEVVIKFESLCYELGIVIEFDWPGWNEGRELVNGDFAKIGNLDLLTLCKLITAIIRNDRFCDGALIASFQYGCMPSILRRLRALVSHR